MNPPKKDYPPEAYGVVPESKHDALKRMLRDAYAEGFADAREDALSLGTEDDSVEYFWKRSATYAK